MNKVISFVLGLLITLLVSGCSSKEEPQIVFKKIPCECPLYPTENLTLPESKKIDIWVEEEQDGNKTIDVLVMKKEDGLELIKRYKLLKLKYQHLIENLKEFNSKVKNLNKKDLNGTNRTK